MSLFVELDWAKSVHVVELFEILKEQRMYYMFEIVLTTGWPTLGIKQGNIFNEKTLYGLDLFLQEGILTQRDRERS